MTGSIVASLMSIKISKAIGIFISRLLLHRDSRCITPSAEIVHPYATQLYGSSGRIILLVVEAPGALSAVLAEVIDMLVSARRTHRNMHGRVTRIAQRRVIAAFWKAQSSAFGTVGCAEPRSSRAVPVECIKRGRRPAAIGHQTSNFHHY